MNFKDWEALIEADPDAALKQAAKMLDDNPDDKLALFVAATCNSRAERFGLASTLFKRCTEVAPDRVESWNNLGMCYSGMGMHVKARQAFNEAWKRENRAMFAANIGMTHYSEREPKRAVEWCQRALAIDPECRSAKATLGLSFLATGEWGRAWTLNAASVGGKFRKELQYQDEPMWDGAPGKTVIFWGEQGIGDEILYASCIPDAIRDCKQVVIECDKRLAGLFGRSFPDAHVYGTRNKTEVAWLADHKLDARLPMGQLPQFYRPTTQSCPGTPYLRADPERMIQWRALFESWGGRPKIGLCWTGGSKYNRPKARNVGLESMRELIEGMDADFISLQYKDPSAEIAETGLPVRHFKRACETDDYDDTAALVAELDMVVGVHTSAQHLAGALGIPALVLVPHKSIWIYDLPSGEMPWYASAKLFRQRKDESWPATIRRMIDDNPYLRGAGQEGNGGVSRLLPIGDLPYQASNIVRASRAAFAA